MSNPNANLRLNYTERVIIRINGNGTRNEQGLKTQVIKRMQHRTKSSMHMTKERNFDLSRTTVMIGGPYSVRIVAKIIVKEIFHNIRVVECIFTVPRRCRWLGMLERMFLGSMQHWITGR